jgi:bacterioferritin-associated ferredoxin
MIVCVCRRVSDRQIRQAVADGAQTLDCLSFELGVATQCGRCADCATRVLHEAQAAACPGRCGGAALLGGAPALAAA